MSYFSLRFRIKLICACTLPAVEGSDMHNGKYIRDNLAIPTATVESILDQHYAEAIEKQIAEAAQ